uniref:LIM zinc-binding domain-containing protein n=1 Tax=Cynoglossus semilaevis TaxID=244447 RepID=A0A3P8WR60_CYNSE
MIYQNSSRLQNVEKEFAQKLNVEGTESRPSDNKPTQPIEDQQEFQPIRPEMCVACQKPVYPMEKITADKLIFHKLCFVCKQCKKKLSIQNYTPFHGEFYCVFHSKQQFRKKGNSDEGFGNEAQRDREATSKQQLSAYSKSPVS